MPPEGAAAYTTVAHWWGGKFEHDGTTFWNEKRVAFLDYLELPARARVRLEVAVCLAQCFDECRQLTAIGGLETIHEVAVRLRGLISARLDG